MSSQQMRRTGVWMACCALVAASGLGAQEAAPRFKAIAFYGSGNDRAHVSFVQEANRWFPQMAVQYGFAYESTTNWARMTGDLLTEYQVVIFLNARPEAADQRQAFQKFMDKGGGWLGFHYAAFALTPSDCPQNWDWYHDQFLGSGEYAGNTWRPTAAVLRVEETNHPATLRLPVTFSSAPNEWYRWERDLRASPDIKVLLSIDPASFPLGTGPKLYEIWQRGDYPVVWTNRKYRMIYLNMGHNDIDYEHPPGAELSFSFRNETQNRLILDSLLWLGQGKRPRTRAPQEMPSD